MRTAALGEIAVLGSGGTPKRSVTDYFGRGVPWLSIADLNDGVVNHATESLTPLGLANSSAKVVPARTLLIAMYGSIGKLGFAGIELCTSQAIATVQPDLCVVDPRYLFQYLLAKRSDLEAAGRGGTQSNISLGFLRQLQIPLPTLDEQHRIAAILDQANAVRETARQALPLVKRMSAAAAQQFFDRHRSCELRPLASLAERVVVGFVGPTSDHVVPEGVPLLRTANVGDGRILEDDMLKIDAAFHSALGKSELRTGDVVLPRHTGDRVRSAIVPEHLNGSNCANIIVVRPSHQILAEVITNFLSLPETQSFLVGRRVGSAQAVVNTTELKRLAMPVLPLDAQKQYCRWIRALDATRARFEVRISELDSLFASLQSRAFSGQL